MSNHCRHWVFWIMTVALLPLQAACGMINPVNKRTEWEPEKISSRSYADRCQLHRSGTDTSSYYSVSGSMLVPFRSVAMLTMTGGHICSAVLVADDKLVTAAHCFDDARSITDLEFKDRYSELPEPVLVRSTTLHPEYAAAVARGKSLALSPGLASVDIAVVQLQAPVRNRIVPNVAEFSINPGKLVGLVGHGDAGRGTGIKRFAQSHVSRTIRSELIGKEHFSSLMLLDSDSGTGACPGDSGGGLFVRAGNDYLLIGVVNGVNDLLYPGFPVSDCDICPQGIGIVTLLSGHTEFLGAYGITISGSDNR